MKMRAWIQIGCVLLLPVGVLGYVFWQNSVPTGVFTHTWTPGVHSTFVDPLTPKERVSATEQTAGDRTQQILGDLVTQFVHPHRSFDRVEAEIWFKNEGAPLVEFGGLAREDGQIYDLKPLSFPLLDGLSWPSIQQDDRLLYQRSPDYASLEDFYANPPDISRVAVYNAPAPHVPANQLPAKPWVKELHALGTGFRGFHDIRTVIGAGGATWQFVLRDMNGISGADAVDIVVSTLDGTEVMTFHLDDDGDTTDSGNAREDRFVVVTIPPQNEGVYKMEWRASRDSIFLDVSTTAQYVVFHQRVDLSGAEASSQVQVVTNAAHVYAETEFAEGTQTFLVNDAPLVIERPFVRYVADAPPGAGRSIGVGAGPVILGGDGVFALQEEMFFVPEPHRLTPNTSLDEPGIDYVITTYHPPEQVGDWFVVRVPFSATVLARLQGAWKFVYSTPGIEEAHGSLRIKKVVWRFSRAPLSWEGFIHSLRELL